MRVLLLEDQEADIILAARHLPEDTQVIATHNRKEFESAVQQAVEEAKLPDIVIVDYAIPGWRGVDAADVARAKWPNMPILVLSGTIDDALMSTLEEKHIDDALLKDRPHRLAWAVRKAIRDRERERRLIEAHEKVLETQRKAMEAQRVQLVGEVAAGVAHDMRNMLTPIMGVLHLFEIYTPSDKLNLLRAAQRSADRLVDLINRMMLFVSGKNGHKEQVQMRTVVLEFLQFLPSLLPEVVITSEVSTNAVLALDPTVVRQVILNFCVNARDAGAKMIWVTAVDVDLRDYLLVTGTLVTGRFCKVSVRDDGHGVPLDVLEKIFDPFFTTKEVGKGTGLGLSTVRNIVQQFGGFVEVKTNAPNGAIFSAYFAIR